ncbi:hypothetical protein OG883_43685 [Streptomyces sp. NBC_01142]|uniref:hypothetical protein n=1 Tax=Streptomyces sp. NBC_01142 TaxID=2975865 RepID=UPI002255F7B6|nr:hypothetical protein [Streptomyces sp. NBC_01142]MCX4826543.1 hypothetical protein [Streptomyces sp. NBC_01142]
MARKDELLTLNEIAKLAGVGRQAAQKWHQVARKTGGEPPLRMVAKAMDVKVPEANDESPRYPRKVVVAFLKAVGYMNADESLMERRGGRGKWAPAKPTIDPRRAEQPGPDSGEKPLEVDRETGGRLRYYNAHAWEIAGFGSENSFTSSRTLGRAPAPDGIDELERPYWFRETLEEWAAGADERKAERYAGRQPDGFTPEGQPFRLLPGDNYYAKKAAEQTGQSDKEEPSK